jgi:Flp pilus assembly protein TadD
MAKRAGETGILAEAFARLREVHTLRQAGQLLKAQKICESLVERHPDYVGALQTLGLIHIARENYWPALSCFVRASMLTPDEWTLLTNLAHVYFKLGAGEMAALTLRRALELQPEDPEVHCVLGEVYYEDRDYELAARSFEKSISLKPDHLRANDGLGHSLTHLGQPVGAARAFETVHAADPSNAKVLYALSQLPSAVTSTDFLEALKQCKRFSKQEQSDFESDCKFVTAAALDKAGRHEEAWQALIDANEIENRVHGAQYRESVPRLEKALSLARSNAIKPAPEAPDAPISLFIVGPSRSGKTTLEAVLAAAAGVRRGYESRIVEKAAYRTFQLSGLLSSNKLSDLPRELESRFGKIYLESIVKVAGGAKVVTNTHPGMIDQIGRIAECVPNARFVFVKRDVNDIVLRILMKKYRSGNHYAYKLQHARQYVAWYYDMIDTWQAKLPKISLCIDYNELVADPNLHSGRIGALSGLGLSFDTRNAVGDDRDCARPYLSWLKAPRH